MVSDRLLRRTLHFSTFYNVFGAFTFAFPVVFGQLAGLPANAPLLHTLFVSSNILLFAFVAAWLARRHPMDTPLLVVFGISEIAFFLVMLTSWLTGEIYVAGPMLAGVDLIMGVIFLLGAVSALHGRA